MSFDRFDRLCAGRQAGRRTDGRTDGHAKMALELAANQVGSLELPSGCRKRFDKMSTPASLR